jgi:hypothetical protein
MCNMKPKMLCQLMYRLGYFSIKVLNNVSYGIWAFGVEVLELGLNLLSLNYKFKVWIFSFKFEYESKCVNLNFESKVEI